MRHILLTNDFPPKVGGIQSYLWELWRRLPPDDVTCLLYTSIAWWQLVHDQPLASDFEAPREVRRSWLHRDDEVPSRPLVWDEALESPELKAYNDYLRALACLLYTSKNT